MAPGIGVVEAVDVAHQHQKIRAAQSGHDGRQRVVIAQHLAFARLDLSRRHRVVFIDHRDDSQLQQRFKRVAQMLRTDRRVHVFPRQEDLSHRTVILRKQLIINVHHHALSHRRRGLLHPKLRRPFLQPQFLCANANGAR